MGISTIPPPATAGKIDRRIARLRAQIRLLPPAEADRLLPALFVLYRRRLLAREGAQ